MRKFAGILEIRGDSSLAWQAYPRGKYSSNCVVARSFIPAFFLSLIVSSALALPINPDPSDLRKHSEPRTFDFPPARAGANDAAAPPFNPVLESLRYPYSREGIRAQLLAVAVPDVRVLALFGFLIFTLRFYRYRKEQPRPAPAVEMPVRAAGTELAA
jgi:hypothetical protein